VEIQLAATYLTDGRMVRVNVCSYGNCVLVCVYFVLE